MATLTWTLEDGVVTFVCLEQAGRLPTDRWATVPVTAVGRAARVGALLRLQQEGQLLDQPDSLGVPARVVATLTPRNLVELGLPPPVPYTVRVEKHGLATDPDFQIRVGFLSRGRPVLNPRTDGPFLKVGSLTYTLLEPAYSLLEAARQLGLLQGADLPERSYWLTQLQEHLPVGATADPYLRQLRLNRADRVTVHPFRLEGGNTGLRVVPARPARQGAADSDGADCPEPMRALPEAREDEFNRHLERLDTDRKCWPVGAGEYLVVSEALRDALGVVKRVRSGSERERLAFIKNPQRFLREQLGDRLSPEQVEELFWESAEYGQRVRDIGAWEPRVLPFIKRVPERWLPETMGLRIDDQLVELSAEDLGLLLPAVQQAIARGEPLVELDGQCIPATPATVEAIKNLIGAATPPSSEPGELVDATPSGARIAVLIEDNLESLGFSRIKRPVSGPDGQLPKCLGTSLFPFQLGGYRWLQRLWAAGAPGALLADDMGLGKTLQALAFLAWLQEDARHRPPAAPILVVGPTGLLRNWRAEHERHLAAPGLGECLEVHGVGLRTLRVEGAASGHELEAGLPVLDVARLTEADWVLTTYETLRDFQHSFARVRWLAVVFDEAQKVKNPLALMTNAAKAIEAQFTLALTGTPVENSLADLWTIADTVQPGKLGALKAFVAEYEADEDASGDGLRRLKSQLMDEGDEPPLMLRRMKEQCLEGLPEISLSVTRAAMPVPQAEAYSQVVRRALAGGRTPGTMLEALQAMRAVSLHPALNDGLSDDEFVAASARLAQAIGILDRVAQRREKALLFLESLEMQGVLVELLQRRYRLSSPPPIINGGVPGAKRKPRVDEFQSRPGFDVMILSPRAGGVGLTITEANHVIHLSRWWNPAVEDQATDRVYRIGQKRPVTVHVPLAVHPELGDTSFDERLHSLLERKRRLSRELLAPPPASDKDLRDLFDSTVRAAHG